jgi:phage-related protein
MQESTEDRQKSECISGQEQFVMEALKMMFDVRMLSEKISNLDAKVDTNDKKHTAAIGELRKFFVDQNLVVVDSVGELKKSIDTISGQLEPIITRENKAKQFILRWSIPTILGLLGVIMFGGYATELGQFVKAVL